MIHLIVAAFCVGFFMLTGVFLQLLLLIGLRQERRPTQSYLLYPNFFWIVMASMSLLNLLLIYSFFHVVSMFLG